MKIQALFCLLLVFGLAMVKGDDDNYDEKQDIPMENAESVEKAPVKADEKTKLTVEKDEKDIVSDDDTKTTALVEHDQEQQFIKNKFCHHGIAVWYKPGFVIRCGCMRCTCAGGNTWDCRFFFPYCPYYYCGGRIYNPHTQVCCCGKIYTKRRAFSCCGYFYYNTRSSKCCNYFTVKPRKANCPRFTIGGKKG